MSSHSRSSWPCSAPSSRTKMEIRKSNTHRHGTAIPDCKRVTVTATDGEQVIGWGTNRCHGSPSLALAHCVLPRSSMSLHPVPPSLAAPLACTGNACVVTADGPNQSLCTSIYPIQSCDSCTFLSTLIKVVSICR